MLLVTTLILPHLCHSCIPCLADIFYLLCQYLFTLYTHVYFYTILIPIMWQVTVTNISFGHICFFISMITYVFFDRMMYCLNYILYAVVARSIHICIQIHACLPTYTYIHNIFMPTSINNHVSLRTLRYINIHRLMHVCLYPYIYDACTHTYIYIFMNVYLHTYTYVHTYLYMHVFLHKYACKYIYTYIQTPQKFAYTHSHIITLP